MTVLVIAVLLAGLTFVGLFVAEAAQERMYRLNRMVGEWDELDYEDYFEKWMGIESHYLLSLEDWVRARDALKLPPTQIKPKGYR